MGLSWKKVGSGNKWKKDEFGRYIYDDNGETIPNPDYAPVMKTIIDDELGEVEIPDFTPRIDRDEWDCVGLLGQVAIKSGQPVHDNWVKMYKISDNADMYYLYPAGQEINNN